MFPFFRHCRLKRSKRIDSSLDYFSAVRTKHAIEEVDVVFLVLDAKEGVTKQDKVLAGHVLDSGKALFDTGQQMGSSFGKLSKGSYSWL